MRILLVEDDEMIGNSLRKALHGAAFAVDWARDGVAGSAALAAGGYVAVLLDLGLPRRAGLDVLAGARAHGDRTPILILTARDAVADRGRVWTSVPMTTSSSRSSCPSSSRGSARQSGAATDMRNRSSGPQSCSSICVPGRSSIVTPGVR